MKIWKNIISIDWRKRNIENINRINGIWIIYRRNVCKNIRKIEYRLKQIIKKKLWKDS